MSADPRPPGPAVLAVHGGASERDAAAADADRMTAALAALGAGLRAGAAVLAAGGPALDAVVAAVGVLEDSGEFNAGRGAVPTAAGEVELDAAVADGHGRRAGAVAAVTNVRNPVAAARAVLARTPHVLLAGAGAAAVAEAAGLSPAPPEWFRRPGREASDTVGAVARDRDGHLAAATSTGGRSGQLPGRVGDSPVPGAGLWADDRTCAVSATGYGEMFVLAAFAHEVDALLRLRGLALGDACAQALEAVRALGGTGGCVAVDGAGAVALPFTSAAMYRGVVDVSGRVLVGFAPGSLAPPP